MRHDRHVQIEPDQLLALLTNPALSKQARERAYELAVPEPDAAEWRSFLALLFTSLGGALAVCGLLFFVDHHWDALSYHARCGLFGSATLLCAVVGGKWGSRRAAGKVALSCASILLGGLLIVASQVYLTGQWPAVLAAWSILILPWCVAARFAPLWLFAVILYNLTAVALSLEYLDPGLLEHHALEIAVLLLNAVFLAIWEVGFRQGWTWMARRWFPPFLTLAAVAPATIKLAVLLHLTHLRLDDLFPLTPALALAWGGWLFHYSKVRRDVSVLSLTLGSGVILATSLTWRFARGLNDSSAMLVLAAGLVIHVTTALGLLRRLTGKRTSDPKATSGANHELRAWLAQMATEGLMRPQQIEDFELSVRAQNELALPWFVRALTGLGAFASSVFLLFYLLSAGVVTKSNGVMFGIGMCALACLISAVMKSELINQACLSMNLCGQLTVWLVHSYTGGSAAATALLMAALELALVVAFPGAFGRFLSVNLCGLFLARCLSLVAPPQIMDVLLVAVAFLVALMWQWQHKILPASVTLAPAYLPVAMGSVSLLFTLLLTSGLWTGVKVGLLTSAGLLLVTLAVAAQMGAPKSSLLGLTSVGLSLASAPGVMGATLVLLLGFYRRNQTIRGLAILFLLGFGSAYYYNLHLSLWLKSLVLMLSGLAFLYAARGLDTTEPAPSDQWPGTP